MKRNLIIDNGIIRFIIAFCIIFQMLSCTRESKKKKNVSIIKFEKTVHDFENILMYSTKSTLFKFSNSNNSSLIINDVRTSCSCTIAKWDKDTLSNNQTGIIKIEYTPDTIGPFVSIIDVYYNGKTVPQKILIKGIVVNKEVNVKRYSSKN